MRARRLCEAVSWTGLCCMCAYQIWPNAVLRVAFWLLLPCVLVAFVWRAEHKLGRAVSAIGGLMNWVVVVSNGFRMPALATAYERSAPAPESWWQPIDGGTRFVWLADVYDFGAFASSLGDFVIAAGAVLVFALWIGRLVAPGRVIRA